VTAPLCIALVGMGKIAHDQHLPAIAANGDFDLVATVSRHGEATDGKPFFTSLDELAASGIAIDAVALCTPPQVRRTLAEAAIARGWHVFLEKPPGATLAEVVALRDMARAKGVSLLASWHSRYAEGVEPARLWLAARTIREVQIVWREDVRVWHPGQHWIWQPGGFGVFDPGINALSIATRLLPSPFFVETAELDVPSNCAAPIAARVDFRDAQGTPISMDLDFRQEGPQSWDIVVETDGGTLTLSRGGAELAIDGVQPPRTAEGLSDGEYPGLYRRFAEIIVAGDLDVDLAPLRLVADIFLRSRFNSVEAFIE
jgi:D-galactose 1-dehydrogenase